MLDRQQIEAVSDNSRHILVRACPGSGKTRVLVERCLAMERSESDSARFLALAYNRDAAASMQERFIASLKNENRRFIPQNHLFSTIHAYCYGLLFRCGAIGNRKVAEASLLREILKRCSMQEGLMLDDDGIDDLSCVISRAKASLDRMSSLAEFHEVPIARMIAAFERMKASFGVIDFDDMLLQARTILCSKGAGDIGSGYQLMLDEAQDMNAIQGDIVELLSRHARGLFCVGDEDQSIYGFRGAKPDFMNQFAGIFGDSSEHLLNCNYRSTQEIVQACSCLIDCNRLRKRKTMQAKADKQGLLPEIISSSDFHEECMHLCRYAGTLHSDEENTTTAVLFRTKRHGQLIAKKMRSMGELHNVVFSTFHSAKGLEFDNVFIAGACEGITPHCRANIETDIEEERRLFYVAASRARKRLFISVPQRDDKGNKLSSSRFVDELMGNSEHSPDIEIMSGLSVMHPQLGYGTVVGEINDRAGMVLAYRVQFADVIVDICQATATRQGWLHENNN